MPASRATVDAALTALEATVIECREHLEAGRLVKAGESLNVAAIHRNQATVELQKLVAADSKRRGLR
jgi:CMP-2-keto-3-deoxyoctulosonic acid synthetase